eukprot:gene1573-1718_t
MIRSLPILACLLLVLCCISNARIVLELESTNFELTLTAYKYIAILFYDESLQGKRLEKAWIDAATLLKEEDLPEDCEIAKTLGSEPDLKELIDAYGITVPSIRVFRRGIISEYRGPLDSDEGIADFLKEDSLPSVKRVSSIQEMKGVLEIVTQTAVFGFFKEEDMVDESPEGYSIDPWNQFMAAADALRGHAHFFVISSEEIASSLKLKDSDLPALFMMPSEGDGLLRYSGEILEMSISEWVLRNSSPEMGELSVSNSAGELYATQFFSSKKLKFILLLKPHMLDDDVIAAWKEISVLFAGKAIFSYMTESSVADVIEYFGIDTEKDLPMIAAHQPTSDSKFKSKRIDVRNAEEMQEFVVGVLTGLIPKVLKSEPLHKKGANNGPVKRLVGNNVIETVSAPDKDVLLAVVMPWCAQCKKLLPTFDLLGRAVQGDSRIVIAKIDGAANDIPALWGVKNYPTLLWFPARDKPYKNGALPTPRPYWDAGYSLQEMVGFVQRDSSFDPKTLKVATTEQLGSLLGDEEILRAKYEEEERYERRNEGRVVYEEAWVDWLIGEVSFDGKRWHVVAGACLGLSWVGMLLYIFSLQSSKRVTRKKKVQ